MFMEPAARTNSELFNQMQGIRRTGNPVLDKCSQVDLAPSKDKENSAATEIQEKASAILQEAAVYYDQIMTSYTRRYQVLIPEKKTFWTVEQYQEKKVGMRLFELRLLIEMALRTPTPEGSKSCYLSEKRILVCKGEKGLSFIRYDTTHGLGKGTYGEIWKTQYLNVAKSVVIKKAIQDPFKSKEFNERAKKDVLNEATKLMQLHGSHSIWGLQAKPYFILNISEPGFEIFGYVGKKYLKKDYFYLVTNQFYLNIPLERKLSEFHQILFALRWIADNNTVHGDLKLENIFLTKKNEIVHMSDFGGSRTIKELIVDPSEAPVASPKYIPYAEFLEVWSLRQSLLSLAVDSEEYKTIVKKIELLEKARDVYAMGVIFYFRLTGRFPYPFDTRGIAIMTERVSASTLTYRGIPNSLIYLVLSMIAPVYTERPTAFAAFNTLEGCIHQYNPNLLIQLRKNMTSYKSEI